VSGCFLEHSVHVYYLHTSKTSNKGQVFIKCLAYLSNVQINAGSSNRWVSNKRLVPIKRQVPNRRQVPATMT